MKTPTLNRWWLAGGIPPGLRSRQTGYQDSVASLKANTTGTPDNNCLFQLFPNPDSDNSVRDRAWTFRGFQSEPANGSGVNG